MKFRVFLFLAAVCLLFSSCAPQPKALEPESGGPAVQGERGPAQTGGGKPAEKTDAEKQLEVFSRCFADWMAEEERDWWGYAVTDLNQDGSWEIVASESHGTGHYTTTSIYEGDGNGGVVRRSWESSCEPAVLSHLATYGGPLPGGPLIMPHQAGTGTPQTYPVYYDAGQDVYHYVYEDSIQYKGEWNGQFTTLRSFSLGCGEQTDRSLHKGAEGVILGYEKRVYHGGTDRWDEAGAYIDKEAYHTLAGRYASAFEEMEGQILWIEGQHLGEMPEDDRYELLKASMDAFLIVKQ